VDEYHQYEYEEEDRTEQETKRTVDEVYSILRLRTTRERNYGATEKSYYHINHNSRSTVTSRASQDFSFNSANLHVARSPSQAPGLLSRAICTRIPRLEQLDHDSGTSRAYQPYATNSEAQTSFDRMPLPRSRLSEGGKKVSSSASHHFRTFIRPSTNTCQTRM
jgi:hypothetical protein